uniref:Holocytochrome c-type synthase n=1 Tax=Tetraselmis sp. GSL018 TaxID=582737 RepID=A0A061RAZ0_9CHLO
MGLTPSKDESDSERWSCPVPPDVRDHVVQYNVYNERIDQAKTAAQQCPGTQVGLELLDPTNNMPMAPNQQPCPGQIKPLSTERETSTIPKGGTDSTWLYPSPQMFFNALRRKGKGEDVTEDDMTSVVAAHNSMNETTWRKVLAWEALHEHDCGSPTLLRFRGRPDQLSPKARVWSWVTGEQPFDRHDWYVDRCGHEVRYVIDFYFREEKAGTPEAFAIDARPAVDSLEAAVDRVKMAIYTKFAEYGWPCPVTGHSASSAAERQPARGAAQ